MFAILVESGVPGRGKTRTEVCRPTGEPSYDFGGNLVPKGMTCQCKMSPSRRKSPRRMLSVVRTLTQAHAGERGDFNFTTECYPP
jgi:hypothetical protein